jgi:hypothetical protein
LLYLIRFCPKSPFTFFFGAEIKIILKCAFKEVKK